MSRRSGGCSRALWLLRDTKTFDVRSGEDALEAIRERRFDLVLLDVNMPGMGGLEACRQIRPTSDVAIIMLTVRDAEQDKVAALDAARTITSRSRSARRS